MLETSLLCTLRQALYSLWPCSKKKLVAAAASRHLDITLHELHDREVLIPKLVDVAASAAVAAGHRNMARWLMDLPDCEAMSKAQSPYHTPRASSHGTSISRQGPPPQQQQPAAAVPRQLSSSSGSGSQPSEPRALTAQEMMQRQMMQAQKLVMLRGPPARDMRRSSNGTSTTAASHSWQQVRMMQAMGQGGGAASPMMGANGQSYTMSAAAQRPPGLQRALGPGPGAASSQSGAHHPHMSDSAMSSPSDTTINRWVANSAASAIRMPGQMPPRPIASANFSSVQSVASPFQAGPQSVPFSSSKGPNQEGDQAAEADKANTPNSTPPSSLNRAPSIALRPLVNMDSISEKHHKPLVKNNSPLLSPSNRLPSRNISRSASLSPEALLNPAKDVRDPKERKLFETLWDGKVSEATELTESGVRLPRNPDFMAKAIQANNLTAMEALLKTHRCVDKRQRLASAAEGVLTHARMW